VTDFDLAAQVKANCVKIAANKELIFSAINALEDKVAIFLRERDKALLLQSQELKQHLENINGLQEKMDNQARLFISADKFNDVHGSLVKEVAELGKWRVTQEGKASQGAVNFTMIISGLSLAIALIVLILKIAG